MTDGPSGLDFKHQTELKRKLLYDGNGMIEWISSVTSCEIANQSSWMPAGH